MEDEINLLDLLRVIRRRAKMLAALFLTVTSLVLIISLLLPKHYKSQTVIIASSSETGGLGAALSALPFASAITGAVGIQTPTDKLLVILKSRTIAEAVIKRFDLLRLFNEDKWDAAKKAWKDPDDPPLMEDAVKLLTEDITTFGKSREGAITITVTWRDPKLAANIANYYVTALSGFLNDKSINVTIQVVDYAVPAERESRPKILLNTVVGGFSALFGGLFLIFFLEFLEKNKARAMGKEEGR